jgi:hypothetical protein
MLDYAHHRSPVIPLIEKRGGRTWCMARLPKRGRVVLRVHFPVSPEDGIFCLSRREFFDALIISLAFLTDEGEGDIFSSNS